MELFVRRNYITGERPTIDGKYITSCGEKECVNGTFYSYRDGMQRPIMIIAWWLEPMSIESVSSIPEINRIRSGIPNKDWQWIADQIDDIMIKDGPDGHTDGSGVITDFIMSLLNGREDAWVTEYEKRK